MSVALPGTLKDTLHLERKQGPEVSKWIPFYVETIALRVSVCVTFSLHSDNAQLAKPSSLL
jgi:hypothetical protein